MLGEKPVFSRATKLSKPPGGAKTGQHQTELVLEALAPEALKRFIDIERASRQQDLKHVAGLYTHILISLDSHPDRYDEYDNAFARGCRR